MTCPSNFFQLFSSFLFLTPLFGVCILQLDRSLDDVMTNIQVPTFPLHFQLLMIQCCALHPKKAGCLLLKSESSYSIGLFPTSSKQDHFSLTHVQKPIITMMVAQPSYLSHHPKPFHASRKKSNKCCQVKALFCCPFSHVTLRFFFEECK